MRNVSWLIAGTLALALTAASAWSAPPGADAEKAAERAAQHAKQTAETVRTGVEDIITGQGAEKEAAKEQAEAAAAKQAKQAAEAKAETKKVTFDDKEAIAGWTTKGDVSIDTSKNREGEGGGSLKIGPGGVATWKLRDADGAGTVELWVYDDMTKPEDAKATRNGPRWGLVQSDGKVLAVGILYAKYLGGDTGYTASDSDGKSWVRLVQWLGVTRKEGWKKWTFVFDPEKGASLLVDGKNVNAARPRFDWNKTHVGGFTSLSIYGDGGKGNEQTIWVDDVTVTLGGAMKAKPTPPAPAEKPAEKPAE